MHHDRARGVLLGLACGDALGRPVEFQSAQRIAAEHGTLTEMVGHGTWNRPAGTVTDDTDQARCIAESLVERGEFDPADVADTLQTALHDGLGADDAEEAIVTAVNRGGDADTIGAIAGAVAGARFGASGLPERWLAALEERERLADLGDRLAAI